MPAQTAKTPGNGSGTLSYTLASDSFDIESVYASIDATTATGPVTAELTVRDQSGVVIARKKQAVTIPAGAAGSATWALRLDDEATASGGGIQFDTYPQSGHWLYIETTDATGSPHGYDFEYRGAGDVGILPQGSIVAEAFHGNITIEADDGFVKIQADTTDVILFAQRFLNLEGDTSIALNSPGSIGVVSPTVDIGSGTFIVTTPASSSLQLDTTGAHFGIPTGDIFVLTDSGGNPILTVDNTTGTPSYHILTGATWAADL